MENTIDGNYYNMGVIWIMENNTATTIFLGLPGKFFLHATCGAGSCGLLFHKRGLTS